MDCRVILQYGRGSGDYRSAHNLHEVVAGSERFVAWGSGMVRASRAHFELEVWENFRTESSRYNGRDLSMTAGNS